MLVDDESGCKVAVAVSAGALAGARNACARQRARAPPHRQQRLGRVGLGSSRPNARQRRHLSLITYHGDSLVPSLTCLRVASSSMSVEKDASS